MNGQPKLFFIAAICVICGSPMPGAAPPAPSSLESDPLLQRNTAVTPKVHRLSQVLERIESATGRVVRKSKFVPDRELFAGMKPQEARHMMEALPPVLSVDGYRYDWRAFRRGEAFGYLLVRHPADRRRAASEVRRRLGTALASAPKYTPVSGTPRNANSAVPARYALLRGLPARTLDQAVGQALAQGQSVLPLSMFDRRTLVDATGRVTATSGDRTSGGETVTFSWRDIERGEGYVVLRPETTRAGETGLRLFIGTGAAPAAGQPITGPTSELIYGTENEDLMDSLRTTRKPGDAGRALRPEPPVDRVTVRAQQELQDGETALANVLRQLADESRRPVVAAVTPKSEDVDLRLSADIVSQPVADAQRTISARYRLGIIPAERALLFRKRPPPVARPR